MTIRKLLVLEDFEGRVDELKALLPFDFIHWVYRVEDFVTDFNDQEWDLVVLDHDLDLTDHNNGQHAVDYLREQPKRPNILIWSINPAGGIQMRKRLQQKGFKVIHSPFPGILRQPASLASLLEYSGKL